MARLLIRLVRGYQRLLSPLKRRPTCRFLPTCSCYAIEAIETHGALRGGLRALWRVLRCNPFGGWGYDPVPSGHGHGESAAARPFAERRQEV
jgi:putative membrane protein insertion efficiency factor